MDEPPKFVDRILDVRQGDICYVVGNVYCAMPLKPDVLEDLTREVSVAQMPRQAKVRPKTDCSSSSSLSICEMFDLQQWLAPQPVRSKYVDYAKDELFIEDQSGRVKLVGDAIRGGTALRSMLITGVVAAVLAPRRVPVTLTWSMPSLPPCRFLLLPNPWRAPKMARQDTKMQRKINGWSS